MSDVRRFWADLCVHHVEAVLYSDYAALEAENAKLRAGQEPVAFKKPSLLMDCNVRYSTSTTPQPSAVPDGFLIVPIQPTEEMRKRAQDYLAAEGMIVSDWLVHTAYTEMLAAAPYAPSAVQVDGWIPVSERLPSAGQLVIASGFIFGKLENGCWVEPAIYEEDDREFHPPKPNEEGDLVADFDATMNHTTHWMPLPPAPEVV